MKAAVGVPGKPELAAVRELADPVAGPGELLVQGLSTGVCGTDLEVIHGLYGELPPGRDEMVFFHESLGRVLSAPPDSGFTAGDLVVGIVRRPDPEPCGACADGQWDFCRNGLYTERGIKALDGYGAQRWTVETDFAVRLDPALGELGVLTEPTSVVAKVWDQIERVGLRGYFRPRTALVTGAGPIGLLAALLGVQRGLDVHVVDRVAEGPKPDLVFGLGAWYHSSLEEITFQPDVVIEATGAPEVVFDVLRRTSRNSITVLTGLSGTEADLPLPGGTINDSLVLRNGVVVGSVNGNLRHYRRAAAALADSDREWLAQLITRRVPLDRWTEVLTRRPDDVKVVVDLS
ncbi:threonine dehydrogenase-like Zn-dependent dehydrogenase [Crossiella equi]|uniref:Threonine dehydrogenase-like Zn-dependent dehydrogenase n=1 Tax=Crossiella equi TaxID=130796 RepID=A0ABS5AGU0_9PSEU|nr:glucose 1-dehydrogenase [Crossiella equi]MBP2475799.1 threonine dehydrogenase-like Zn-dependent dehydrogenase [Crossiella equi]